MKGSDGHTPLAALKLFSNLDHTIRDEARSYLYANNVFRLMTMQSLMKSPDYIETYIRFLEVGRHSLWWLNLAVRGDSKQHIPNADKAKKLWMIIGDCINLSFLDVYAEIDYFYMDRQTLLQLYMTTEGSPVRQL
jgi:hypothetical protein